MQLAHGTFFHKLPKYCQQAALKNILKETLQVTKKLFYTFTAIQTTERPVIALVCISYLYLILYMHNISKLKINEYKL